jgi:hypothetical protein
MRKLLFAATLLAFFAPVRADDAADAKKLVERSIKAGNLPDPAKMTGLTWKDKGKFTAMGLELNYTADWAVQFPDKYRFSFESEFGGMKINMAMVAAGEKAWESAMGQTQEITGEKLEYVKHEMYEMWVTSLHPLLIDKGFKLSPSGEKAVGEKKATGVKVEQAKHTPITLYFDNATGLLVKAETRVKDEFQGWKEVPSETYYEDYKDVDGRTVFMKLRVVRDGKQLIESAVSDGKWHEKLDPKLFEKP